MKIYNFYQNTDEWINIRKGKFTASDATAIATAGKGLETLVFEKASEITALNMEIPFSNSHTDRGHDLEGDARIMYELETGNTVEQVGFCELDEFTGASPDGMVDDDGLVEIKCLENKKFIEQKFTGKIDTGHIWQIQMQMHVTGRQWCDYCVYSENFKDRLLITRVERDEITISKIKAGLDTGIAMLKNVLEKINN